MLKISVRPLQHEQQQAVDQAVQQRDEEYLRRRCRASRKSAERLPRPRPVRPVERRPAGIAPLAPGLRLGRFILQLLGCSRSLEGR